LLGTPSAKNLLQSLRSHTQSFRTLWKLLKIPPFVRTLGQPLLGEK
jgi:hypothetical protein